jgi:hypothetical protein
LVPKVILTRSKILVDADYDGSYNWDNKLCKNKTRFDKAKLFMKDDVADVEDIEMYFLGKSIITYPARFIPIDSGIYTSSDTIYIIAAKAGCIDDITIVHELTHVWQNQNENTIKMKDTLEEYKNMIKYFTKRDDLYSYGGIAGLESAKNSGMTFKDFGEEQQARMVEDYYTIKHSNLKYFTDDLEPLLQYFLEPEFNFAKE